MTVDSKVINRFESFVLGKCRCGCNTDIEILNQKKHLKRFYKNHNGIGKNNGKYKTGTWTTRGGYTVLTVPSHPRSNIRHYIYEHIIVMEKHLGRYLTPDEVVHHKNHIPNDNRIENLELFKNHSEHMKYHMKKVKRWQ